MQSKSTTALHPRSPDQSTSSTEHVSSATQLQEKIDAENIELIINFVASFHEHYDEHDKMPLREALGCDLEQLDTFTLMAIVEALKA